MDFCVLMPHLQTNTINKKITIGELAIMRTLHYCFLAKYVSIGSFSMCISVLFINFYMYQEAELSHA